MHQYTIDHWAKFGDGEKGPNQRQNRTKRGQTKSELYPQAVFLEPKSPLEYFTTRYCGIPKATGYSYLGRQFVRAQPYSLRMQYLYGNYRQCYEHFATGSSFHRHNSPPLQITAMIVTSGFLCIYTMASRER